MIPTEDFRKKLGKHVLLGRRTGDKQGITWYSGIIDEIFDESASSSSEHDYGIQFTDKRIFDESDEPVKTTMCTIEHKSLYEIPVTALTGNMTADGVRKCLQASPDYTSSFGSRDDHIENIVNNLGTILENYQIQLSGTISEDYQPIK